jgi:hypothetical protein
MAQARIQGAIWEIVHTGEDSPAPISGTVSYQAIEIAFMPLPPAQVVGRLYENMTEVAWKYDYGYHPPPPPPAKRNCGVLINPDFSINTYGLRTLSCERLKAPGVEQVPFRLAHKDNMGLRRKGSSITPIPPVGYPTGRLYEAVTEVAWVWSPP